MTANSHFDLAREIIRHEDGLVGAKLAWKRAPDVVVADEITGRMGAFALTLELKGAEHPFPGVVVILQRTGDLELGREATQQ